MIEFRLNAAVLSALRPRGPAISNEVFIDATEISKKISPGATERLLPGAKFLQ